MAIMGGGGAVSTGRWRNCTFGLPSPVPKINTTKKHPAMARVKYAPNLTVLMKNDKPKLARAYAVEIVGSGL